MTAIGERRESVLVAQSLGGFTALIVCERVPVELLVLVNAMIPAPAQSGAEWWTNTRHERARAEHAARTGWDLPDEFDPLEEFFHAVLPANASESHRTRCLADTWSPSVSPRC